MMLKDNSKLVSVRSSVMTGSYKKFQRDFPYIVNKTLSEALSILRLRTTKTSKMLIRNLLSLCVSRYEEDVTVKSLMINKKGRVVPRIRYGGRGRRNVIYREAVHVVAFLNVKEGQTKTQKNTEKENSSKNN